MTNVIEFPVRHCPYALRVKQMMDAHKVPMPLVQIGWVVAPHGKPTRTAIHKLTADAVGDGFSLIIDNDSLFVTDNKGKSFMVMFNREMNGVGSNAGNEDVKAHVEEMIGLLTKLNWQNIATDITNSNRVKKARDKRQ